MTILPKKGFCIIFFISLAMERDRTSVIHFFLRGKSPGEIMKALEIPQKRRKFVYRTIKRYQDTGSVVDKPRSGRPVTATSKRMRGDESDMAKSPTISEKNGL